MKKALFFIFFLTQFTVSAQSSKRAYFIGNSYTASNNLPHLIDQIANSTNDGLDYQTHLPGGSTLQQHAQNPTVQNVINQGDWDYVILQEQSLLPAFPNANATLNAAEELSDLVKSTNVCGNVLFYMTWGRKFGDDVNCNNGVTYLCTYEGMDDKLYERYMQMTEDNDAIVSPVGFVWRTIREQYPDLELYTSDNSHPSYLGSMAAAYTFYTVIFHKDPTLATFDGTLSSTEASILKNVVKEVVYNQLTTWKVGINDIATRFSVNATEGATVHFQNDNESATMFTWDFGDGTSSNEENPTHTYTANGNYQVTLISQIGDCQGSASMNIEITELSQAEFESNTIKVFPNPSSDFVMINHKFQEDFTVFDANGKKITLPFLTTDEGTKLDIRAISEGVYFIRWNNEKQQNSVTFIKK